MNTRSRWGSSSAACAPSRPARPIRSARPRRGSPRMRLSPVCARRSNRTRCAARCCWRRAACATSPAGSTRRCTLPSGTTPRGTSPIRCTSALTRSSRAVWRTGGLAVGILLSGGPPVRLSAQTIDTIVVVNHNIFDLSNDAPGLLARLANALHVTTRAGVIRRTLFVNPGDRYDSARVAESERALRALYVFSRVRLDTTRIAGRLALRVGVSAGLALQATSRGFVRLWASGEWRREDFGPESTFVFPRSTFGAVGAGVDVGHVRFNVLERFNSYARREDVDLSQLLHVGVWAAPRAWGYPSERAGVGPELSGQVSALWRGGFAVLRGGANGVYTAAGLDTARVTGSFTVASQNLRRQTLILHLEGGALRRPKPGAEFDLWVLEKGPRVFGIHQFTGTRMLWLALEDRILVRDELWGLVGLGIAPFFDYGGAWWYGDEPTRLGGDVGLALRMGPTRAVHGDVGEIALGYRFGRGFGGWAVAVRKGVAF